MIILGDCVEEIAKLEANSIDAIVTDPPYGLSFMGKKWDYDVPSVELWREVIRVLKPGGHLLSFGGTRTYHRMVVAIEDAGFEIRDQVMWIYGSGFPKSMNVGKKVEAFEGWGTALKPANEPIVLARKPLEKGLTVAENVLKWGTGAMNIDGGRIGNEVRQNAQKSMDIDNQGFGGIARGGVGIVQKTSGYKEVQGRWPANVLFDESAAELLDEQSGITRDGVAVKQNSAGKNIFSEHKKPTALNQTYGGQGGASRFFYVAKTSKRERNAGLEALEALEGQSTGWSGESMPLRQDGSERKMPRNQNFHPTVKPIRLMEYLIKLITPPSGTILDPFMGSGSTGCAAVKLGFNFIGIEREAEYIEIAKRRIEHWTADEPAQEINNG